jgi:hypothetical protein
MRERVEAAARQLGYDGPTFETTPGEPFAGPVVSIKLWKQRKS